VVADTDYLRRAILDPSAERVAGAAATMPRLRVDDGQLEALIAYIESLADDPPG